MRKMSALQKKYFGKRHKKTRVVKVARYKRTRRYYAGAKRGYRRARGLGMGKFSGMIPPLLGGLSDNLLVNMNILGFRLPSGVGATAIGYFMKSPTTRDIGLYSIGHSIPGMFGMGGQTNGFVGQGD